MFFMLLGLAIGLIATGLSGGFDNKSNTGIEASAEAETAFVCEGKLSDISKNLYYFPNLESIVTTGSLYESGLAGLDRLTSIECGGQRIDDIAKILPHPENITILKNVYAAQNVDAALNFPNLKVFQISLDEVKDLSPLGKLTGLKSVIIYSTDLYSTDFLSNLEELPELESLWLSQCYSLDSYNYIDDLGQLDNLKSLTFTDMQDLDLSVIGDMDGLEKLYIKGVRSVKNAEKLFDAPNIKDVTLYDEWIFMDFANINRNDSLEKLTIRYCEFREGSNGVEFADNVEFLAKLPGLKELEIRGTKLENVDFVRELPSLKRLDVTNNYVSDVSAINDCPNIEELWCGDNVISSTPEFNHPVTVHMDEESMWEDQ